MFTQDEINKQRALNHEDYLIRSGGELPLDIFLQNRISDCSFEFNDLIKAMIKHVPNIQSDKDIANNLTKRLESCLDFDIIPVHYNVLDRIGSAVAFALDPEELAPDLDELKEIEKIICNLQNIGY